MRLITNQDLDDLRVALQRIEALATNPHWSADRRWKIAEHATKARTTSLTDNHSQLVREKL
jgi:hypothetical protein